MISDWMYLSWIPFFIATVIYRNLWWKAVFEGDKKAEDVHKHYSQRYSFLASCKKCYGRGTLSDCMEHDSCCNTCRGYGVLLNWGGNLIPLPGERFWSPPPSSKN